MEQLTGWVLFTNSPCAQKLFLWLKMAFEYFWLESILITTPWQRRYLFANLTIVTFFTITLFSFEVDCQGFQTRPGAKVQLYRPSNLLFWLNTAQDKADTLSYF
jgi:hypothetical protein